MVFTPRFRGRPRARGGGVGSISFAPKGPGPQQFNEQNVNKNHDRNPGGFSGAKNDAPATSAESLRITVGNEIYRDRQEYQQHGPVNERLGPQNRGDVPRINQYGSGRGDYPNDQYRPPDRGPDTDRHWDHDREQLDRDFKSIDYGHGRDKHGDFKNRPESISVERADNRDFKQGYNVAPAQPAGQRYSVSMTPGGSMNPGSSSVQKFSASEPHSNAAQQRPLKSILKKVGDSGLQPTTQSQPPTLSQPVPSVSAVPGNSPVSSLPEVNKNYPSLPGISNYMDPDDEKFLYGDGPPGSNFAQKTAVTSTVYESVSSFVSQQRSLSDKLTVTSSNLSMSNMSSTNTVSGLGTGVSYGSSQPLPSVVMNRTFGQGPQERAGGNFVAGNQFSGTSFNSGLSNIGQSQQSLFPVQNQPKLQSQQSQDAPLQRVGGGSGGEGSDFWGMLAKSLQTVKETQCNQGQGQMVTIQAGSTAPAAQTFIQGAFPQDGRNTANMFGNQTKLASQQSLFPSGVQGQISSTQEQVAMTSQLPQTASGANAKSKEDYDPTIENILKSIGFDFDMSKRMQEKAKQSKSTDVVEETQFGINQTASFLGGTDLNPAELKSQLFDRGRGKDYRQSSLREPDESRRYADDDVEKMIREAQETVRQAKRDLNSREMSALKYINEVSPIPAKDSLSPRSDRSREIQRRKIIESVSKAYDKLPDMYEKINSPDRFGGGFENDMRQRYDSSSQNRFSPRQSPGKWPTRRSRSRERRETQGQHNYRSPDESSKRLMTAGRRSVSIERQSGSAGRKSWSRSPPRKRSRSGSRGRWQRSRSFDRQHPSVPLGRRSRSRSRGRQSRTRSSGQRSRSRSFGKSRSPGRLSWSRSRSRSHSRSRRLSPEKQKDSHFESQPPHTFQPYQGDNPPQSAYAYPNTSQPYEYGPPMPVGQPYGPFPFGPGYGPPPPGYGPPPPGYGPPPPGYGPPPGVPGFGPNPINQGYGPPHSGGGFQGPPPGFGNPPPPGVPGYGPPPGYIPNTYSQTSQKATGESAPSRTLLYPPIEDKDTSLKKERRSLSLDRHKNSQDLDTKSPSKDKSSKDIDVSKTRHSSKDKLPKKEESSNRTVLPPKSEYHRTVVIGGPRVKKDDEKAKDTISETKQNTSNRKASRSVSNDRTAGSDIKPTAKTNSLSKPSKTEGAIDKEQQKELEGKHKLLAALQKELERLKKQQNELMRQKRRQKDGHKDPVLLQNSQLQEEIMKQIEKIKSKMGFSKDIGKEEDSKKKEADSRKKEADSRKKEADSKKKVTESKKDTETKKKDTESRKKDTDSKKKDAESKKETDLSKKDAESSKEEQSTKNVKDIKAAEKDNEKPVLTFYDGGNHWCKLCNEISSNLIEYFQHLRTQKHLQKAASFERPWVPDSLKNPKKKLTTLKSSLTQIAGVEFVMAADAFYCSLCREFSGDVNCSEAHLESEIHNKNYQKYCEENPLYEKRMMLDKATAISLKKAEESRKRKLESSAKEDNEKKPKLDSESDSTVAKIEETVKSDIEMKRAGFGKFKWEKQDSNSSEKNEMEVEEEEVQLPLPAPPSGVVQAQKSKGKISINLQFKGGIKSSPPVVPKASVLPPWQPVSKKSEQKASPASKPIEIFPLRKKADVEPPPLDMFLSVEGTESKVPVIETKKKISAKEILEAFTGKYKEKVEKAAENATESKDQRSDTQSKVAEPEDQSRDSEDKSSTTVTMTLSSQEEEADMILMGIDPKSSEPLATIKPPPPVSQNMNLPIKDSRASSSAKEMYGIFFNDEEKESGDGKVEVSVEFKLFDINESFIPTSSQKKPQETLEKLGQVQTESIVTGFSLDDVPLPVGDGPSQNSEQGPNEDNEKRRDDTATPQADVNLVSEMSDKQADTGTSADNAGEQYSVINEGKTDEQQGMDESINITESAVSENDISMNDVVAEPITNVDNDNNKSMEVAGESEKSIQNETSFVEANEVPITVIKPELALNQMETESAENSDPVEESAEVVPALHGFHNQGAESNEAKQSEVKQKSFEPIEKEIDSKEMTLSQTTEQLAVESKQDQKPVIPSKRTTEDENSTGDIPFKQSKVAESTSTQAKETEDKHAVQAPSPKKPTTQTKGKQKRATGSKVPQAAVEEVQPTKPKEKPSPSKSDSTTTSPGTSTRLKRGAANKETTQTEPRRTTRASTRATRSSARLAQAAQKIEDMSRDEGQTTVDSSAIEEQDIGAINDAISVSPSVGNKDIISATSVSDKKDTDAGKKSVDKQTLSPEKEGQNESDSVTKSEDKEAILDETFNDAGSDCSGISMQLGSDFEVVDECDD